MERSFEKTIPRKDDTGKKYIGLNTVFPYYNPVLDYTDLSIFFRHPEGHGEKAVGTSNYIETRSPDFYFSQ